MENRRRRNLSLIEVPDNLRIKDQLLQKTYNATPQPLPVIWEPSKPMNE
jgi:hypothetical protein